jgi:VanZ family protein
MRPIALPLAVVFAFLVAILDEGYQNRLLYRTGSVEDVLIDGLGIAVAALGLWIATRWSKQNKEVAEDVENKR